MHERKPLYCGGCQCGAVRFALYASPERVHLCHCRMCQKAVGGPFAAFAPVRKTDFAWTAGNPATFLSSSVAARDFCAACGTPLTFRYLEDDWIDVTIGSLDRPELVAPDRLLGVESRLAWLDHLDALPRFTTEETMDEQHRSRLVNRQHPDREDPPATSG